MFIRLNSLKSELKTLKISQGAYIAEKSPLIQKIDFENKQIIEYSEFNTFELGEVLAFLISNYTNNEYVCKEIDISAIGLVNPNGNNFIARKNKLFKAIVIKENDDKNEFNYENDNIKSTLKKFQVVLDFAAWKLSSNKKMYGIQKNLTSNISYNTLDYIRDFIDFLIETKIRINKKSLSKEEMVDLAYYFMTHFDYKENKETDTELKK